MPASIGVNLRVTGNCRQGGRKYMEDSFSVAYQQTEDEKDLEYAFFGIYDGHGGVEAASFAKEHLMETIIKHKNFWSDNDEEVLRAIRDGYIATHYDMWREQSKWPRTSSGLPSTAGTTASVAFIRRGKIYIGHVGDSGIILGYQEPGSTEWKAKPLTKDHKPETPEEMRRIERCGGKVVSKSGVPRVVWNRPKIGHQGPVRRSTPIDEIPFLAVARSLGDLWSYNSQNNQFVVSPDPDCSVLPIDTNIHRCLIFGTDGLFNMLSPTMAVHIVQQAERHNECEALSDDYNKVWLNPSKLLVEKALDRWHATKMRADNTSAVTLMLDPPGPPRAQVLKDRKKNLPESGLKIVTRYDESAYRDPNTPSNAKTRESNVEDSVPVNEVSAKSTVPLPPLEVPLTKLPEIEKKGAFSETNAEPNESFSSSDSITSTDKLSDDPAKQQHASKVRESTSFDPRDEPLNSTKKSEDNTIQINEISSSNIEERPTEDEALVENESLANIEQKKESKLSCKSLKKTSNAPEKKAQKRKIEVEDNNVQQRKSMRLSLTQKFLVESKKPAPCTLAEEKLKKLAEEAEKSKMLTEQGDPNAKTENTQKNKIDTLKKTNVTNKSIKLSITQKILKNKKTILKKKRFVKAKLKRKKIKKALEMAILKTGKKATPKGRASCVESTDRSLRSKEKKIVPDTTALSQVNAKTSVAQEKVTTKNNESNETTLKTPEKADKLTSATKPKPAVSTTSAKEKVILGENPTILKRQSLRNASIRSKEQPPVNKTTNSLAPVVPVQTSKTGEKEKHLPLVVKTTTKEKKEPIINQTQRTRADKLVECSSNGKLQVLNSNRETKVAPVTAYAAHLRSSRSSMGSDIKNEAKENIKAAPFKGAGKNAVTGKAAKRQMVQTKTTLHQKIQDKTKSIKKSVLKKSR